MPVSLETVGIQAMTNIARPTTMKSSINVSIGFDFHWNGHIAIIQACWVS